MKLTNLLCMGALSALALTACVDNDNKSEWNDGSQPISFNASIQGMTRAAGSKWTAGDQVGIFMKVAGGDLSTAASLNGVNKLHTTDANGILTAGNADNALYYPSDASKSVDFIAYYPYAASLTNNTYKVNVSDQSNQPVIDLLYSDNATGFAKGSAANPQLKFSHQLSQIVFNITKDATVPTLDGLTITFKGMNTTADFTLADGTLANAAAPADIKAAIDGASATTIVLPAASLADVKVVFSLNGKDFTTDYPQTALESGRKYVHNVALSDQNGQPTITMDAATIEDWIEVPGGDINVDFGEGTDTPDPDPIPGEETVLINETFGDPEKDAVTGYWPSIDIYTGWTDKSVKYSDPLMTGSFSNASVRSTSTLNGHVWFAANKDAALRIEGFKAGCTNLKLTYQIAANTANAEQNNIKVITDKGEVSVPSATIPAQNAFQSVELTLPDGCSYVQFTSTAAANTVGYRIDNVKLVANAGGEGGDVVDPTPDPDPTPATNLVVNPGFEDWTGALATGWDSNYNTPADGITKSTDIKHSGNNALKQVSASSTSKIQQEIAVVGGKTYKISYWYLDNDAKASTRVWSTWVAGTTALKDNLDLLQPTAYSTDNAEWQKVEFTLTAPATATIFRFEARTYKQSASAVGGFIYYDDFEMVEVAQ